MSNNSVCSGLNESWDNMIAELPVRKGTAVMLSCRAGYQMSGDTMVVCIEGTTFGYHQLEPKCGKNFSHYTKYRL